MFNTFFINVAVLSILVGKKCIKKNIRKPKVNNVQQVNIFCIPIQYLSGFLVLVTRRKIKIQLIMIIVNPEALKQFYHFKYPFSRHRPKLIHVVDLSGLRDTIKGKEIPCGYPCRMQTIDAQGLQRQCRFKDEISIRMFLTSMMRRATHT